MILFKEDWAKYPTAIVDYHTNNQSFLHLASLYHDMGIDNCEFLLALYQPDLVGVNPHDPDLDQVTMQKIGLECRYNPWYYFREVARVPAVSGSVPSPFKANRGNIALYWCFFNHIDIGLIQIRQTGKSTSTDVLMVGLLDIWTVNTEISLITKDHKLRQRNIQRLKEIRDLNPAYIHYPNPMDVDNKEMLTNVKFKNYYKSSVGRNDRIAADRLGRGMTVPIQHYDEFCYIPNIGISFPVALSSGSAARDEAAGADQPYGNILTTTAGQLNSRDGAYGYQILSNGAPWSEKFFDLPNRQRLEKVIENACTGKKPLIHAVFNHRQLGYTDAWLARKMRENAAEGDVADRDWMNIHTTGTEGSPLTREEKDALNSSKREPRHVEITEDNYIVNWFVPQAQIDEVLSEDSHILALDPSEGLGAGGDANGGILLNTRTHNVTMAFRLNETNTTSLGRFIARLLITHPSIAFIPERKSLGVAILDILFIELPKAGIDPFRRIYNRIVDDPENHRTDYKTIQQGLQQRPAYFYDRYKRYFGFNTSGSGRNAREALYGTAFKEALRLGARRANDGNLIDEILALVIKNGRIDHQAGNHDDMVIAWLMAHWFLTQGRNLNFYGIDARTVFTEAVQREEEMGVKDRIQLHHQRRYLHDFNRLMEELKRCQDPGIIGKLETQLRHLSQRFDIQEHTGVGIDAMIEQVKDEKSRKAKLHRHTGRSSHHLSRYLNQGRAA